MLGVSHLGLIACGTLLTAAMLAATPQDPPRPSQSTPPPDQQRPVFRTGVDVVRVDVYPRHRNRIVPGLTRDDFRLTEDGVAQTIETFEYISIDMDRAGEPLDPRSASEARRMAADPRNRVFVFYLDTYEITMEGSYRAREPLLEFLQRSMGPRDLFAWMTPKQSPEFLEFTRMTQGLATLMTVVKPWGQKDTPVDDPKELELQGCAPGPLNGGPNGLVTMMRNLEVLTDLKELITRLGGLREERKNLVILGERWQNTLGLPARSPVPTAINGQTPSIRMDQGGRGSFVPPSSPMVDGMRKCDQIRSYLMRQDFRGMTRDLPDLARRNNVALYFVPLAPKSLFNLSLAQGFALETDGRSIVSNDIGANLEQVLEHQTGFYMLGYRSTAGEAGKKSRTVRVRTTKSGVDLDVRRIYEPPPAEFLAARSAPVVPVERSEVEKAIDGLPPPRDDAEIAMHAVSRPDAVDVTVEIAARFISTEPWRSGGKVIVSLRDAAGVVVASGEASIAAGARGARVRIPAGGTPRPARATAQITHAGGATLSDAIAIDVAGNGGIGIPVLSRAGALPRLPFVPAAEFTFGRTERLRIEWPLAGALSDPRVRLRNAKGEELAADVSLTTLEGSPAVLRADARLLSLAPGTYVFEAAGEVNGAAVRQLVAIRVTR